ncbi:MAG: Xaa-Pro peptidase family protein [Rubrivivax sp.]
MTHAIPKQLVFPVAEYEERLRRVRQRMQERQIDVLLVHGPENIFYLSGYQTPGYYMYHCLVVPIDSEPVLVMRRGELGNFEWRCWLSRHVDYVDVDDPVQFTANTVRELSGPRARIGAERRCWFFVPANYEKLKSALPTNSFAEADGLVEDCRLVKSALEIQSIRAAARASEKGLQAGMDAVRTGTTDNAVSAEVHRAMIEAGSEYVALGPFIASGLRATITHGNWGRNPIKAGQSVMLEVGACVNRYHAAIFRTVAVGEPSERLKYMAELSDEANLATLEAIRPGATTGEIHEICQGVFQRSKLPQDVIALRRSLRTGYSIGLAFPPGWGEWDYLDFSEGGNTVLVPGMVFHVVTAIRDYGVHGAAYSETVLVTETGHELITQFPRTLFLK